MDRRSFMATFATAAAGVAVARPASAAPVPPARPGPGPFGPLRPPDANGVRLPAGFRSRVIAVSGQPVAATGYPWHPFPDGGATFPRNDGGWTYVANSEVTGPGLGGVSQIDFAAGGRIIGANRVLSGTTQNCSGGATPWGTWLSCEETPLGLVHECTTDGSAQATARPALGVFSHEMVAVDPVRGQLYMTEDDLTGDGDEFYRFTPDNPLPDLSAGRLQVLRWDRRTTAVRWIDVDATVPASTRRQAGGPTGTVFEGNEGVWYHAGHVYFTAKGTNRVFDLDISRRRLTVLWDARRYEDPVLSGVDNLVMDRARNLYVAEDGGNMELVVITRGTREVAPFLRLPGNPGSEITGPAFSPNGRRLYFSSQRGGTGGIPGELVPEEGKTGEGIGITYEVTGPFPGHV